MKMSSSPTHQSYLKSPYKSIKYNTYFDSYDHFFSKYRNQKITFVEIGVLGGGSLFMWRNYFGPQARIIGVDLNPNAKKWEADGFEIHIGSQSDMNFWKNFTENVGLIDILLDDGGHTYEQQIITTECLLSSMKDGGIIVIEDSHTSYMDGFGPRSKSFINYTKKLIDKINMRYEKFSDFPSERRIWSIEIVESMVAFKINHLASNRVCEAISNGGKDDLAVDFRYSENREVVLFDRLVTKMRFLKYLPFLPFLKKWVRNYLANRKFSADDFFK